MHYFTVMAEGGLVLDVIEAENTAHALRLARELGFEPVAVQVPALIIVKDRAVSEAS